MTAGIPAGVIGAGYVGLTTAVCLAERGIDTISVDVDRGKLDRLSAGDAVIDEPLMPELLRSGLSRGTLRFTDDYSTLCDRDVVFICVPTPSGAEGAADLRAVDATIDRLGGILRRGAVVVLKSTVPIGTTRRVAIQLQGKGIEVVSSPEFLREGHAVEDFRHPDRLVIGALNERAAELVRATYGPTSSTAMHMSPESAELAKYASNAFLAVKLSYANSLAELCARVDADIIDVTRCMGADHRIGEAFLTPGPGWGGSCLPKDTAALLHMARSHGVALAEVEACRATNTAQPSRVVDSLRRAMGRPLSSARVTVLGLTFKSDTSDTRDSPSLAVCAQLAEAGAHVSGYDPALGAIDPAVLREANVTAVDDPYRAAKATDAIVVLTEWTQFADLDWTAIAEQAPDATLLDARNLLDPKKIERTGLSYLGNGRPSGF